MSFLQLEVSCLPCFVFMCLRAFLGMLDVVTPSRTYYLQVVPRKGNDERTELQFWLDGFNQWIQYYQKQQSGEQEERTTRSNVADKEPQSNASAGTSNTTSSDST